MQSKLMALGAIAFVLAASTARADTQEFVLDGSVLNRTLKLASEEKHMVYQTVEYEATCSKEVFDGYETVCNTTYEQECTTTWQQVCHQVHKCNNLPPPQQVCWDDTECTNKPVQSCHSVPHTSCHQEAQYHTEYYTCIKTKEVPVGEELDFRVDGEVTLKFPKAPQGVSLNEVFAVSLDGAKQSMKLKSNSKRVLIYLDKKSEDVKIIKPDGGASSPGYKKVVASYEFKFLSVSDVTSPISQGIEGVSLDIVAKTISFDVGKVLLRDLFGFTLKLKRDKFWGDKTVVESEIRNSDLSFADQGSKTRVTARLASYEQNEFKDDSTYKVEATVSIKSGSSSGLLNPEALPSSQSVFHKVKIKVE